MGLRAFGTSTAVGISLFLAPFAFAQALSISIQSLDPGASVPARTMVTFKIVPSAGFTPRIYTLFDGFGTSTVSSSNITLAGQFSWTPIVSDVGTHSLTITASDNFDGVASTTKTIIVEPAPSVSIRSVTPGNVVLPNTKLTFSVSTSGFTNPSFYVSDSFNGTSISSANLDPSGNFSWTPDVNQNGVHTISIYATDASGRNASGAATVRVGNAPTLIAQATSPAGTINPGQAVSFPVTALGYLPTTFTVFDSFSGASTVTNASINGSGFFAWTPAASDVGTHVLTITGTVGVFGESASTTKTVLVLAPGQSAPAPTVATSSADSDAALTALKAKILALQAQLTAASNMPSSVTTNGEPPSARYVFKRFIGLRYRGTDVLELQKRLAALGYFSATPTGYFGVATEAAVKRFQTANDIRAAGYVGPATRAALNK